VAILDDSSLFHIAAGGYRAAQKQFSDQLRVLLGISRSGFELLQQQVLVIFARALRQPARQRGILLQRAKRAPQRRL
jgi:hypothetical protein